MVTVPESFAEAYVQTASPAALVTFEPAIVRAGMPVAAPTLAIVGHLIGDLQIPDDPEEAPAWATGDDEAERPDPFAAPDDCCGFGGPPADVEQPTKPTAATAATPAIKRFIVLPPSWSRHVPQQQQR